MKIRTRGAVFLVALSLAVPAQAQITTTRVSVSSDGVQGNHLSGCGGTGRVVSLDGRFVTFSSLATNLVSGDTNGVMDVFVRGPFDWVLFADDFEDGTTAAWFAVTP